MKIAFFGTASLPLGLHNLKDPRLDRTHELVKADKKTYAQIEVAPEKEIPTADAIVCHQTALSDLLTRDLDFIEARLGRNPEAAEQAVLEKLAEALVSEIPVCRAGLTAEELDAVAAHRFTTGKPVTLATDEDLAAPEGLWLRAFREAGFLSFLTVGGKENRAWPIPVGATAWEAAGAIHTDIQKGFIRAEIIGFDDFLEAGGETEAKRAGKQRLELKTYAMQDYDVTNFRFNK